MKCPACEGSLNECKIGDVALDICQSGCGGVWFDWKELKKFDEPHEVIPEGVLKSSNSSRKKSGVRFCPKCEGEELCLRYNDIKNEVEIDQCLKCSGIWLDTGELKKIRSQYQTEEERFKAADNWLASSLKKYQEEMVVDTAIKTGKTIEEIVRIGSDDVIEQSALTQAIHQVFHFLLRK